MRLLDSVKSYLLGSALVWPAAVPAQKPVNIVYIIADDVSWDDIGIYGNKVVKTPNLDRLATGGLCFTNAFLTTSSCSPSRCSIISGKYPHSTGAAELHTPLPAEEIPFPLLLKGRNYYTAQAGKWHLGPAAHRAFDRYTDENGYDNGDGGEANWVRFLRERPKDKPFFFWFASHDAHRPWGADSFRVTHNPEDMQIPPYFADDAGTRQDMTSYYNEIARFDYYVGVVQDELRKQGVLENTCIIVMADNGRPFPRCKTRVYDSGMKTPLIISWPGGLRQKGVFTNSLVSAVDLAPTILEIAGVPVPSAYQGISFVPILQNPTAEIRNVVYSEHNWHDYEAYERMARTKDFLYVYNGRPSLPDGGPADSKKSATQAALNRLRDQGRLTPAQADIFITPRPSEELFAVTNDPNQFLNLASVPAYQPELEAMRRLLLNWQLDTRDSMPESLTPDWYDRETGDALKKEQLRGTMPGYVPQKN